MRTFLQLGLRTVTFGFAAVGLVDFGASQCTLQTIPPGPGGSTAFNDVISVSDPYLALRAGSGDEVDVYVEVAGDWQLQSHLTGFEFVNSLALDGNRLAIGDVISPSTTDAVRVYERQGSSWNETAVLLPADPQSSDFGVALALAGTTLLVGDTGANGSGRVLHYEEVLGSWVLVDTLAAPVPQEGGGFGFDLALDGGTLMIGEATTLPGRVHVFEYENGAYESKQVIVGPADSTGLGFGFSVALSGDLGVVGSPLSDITSFFGRAWVLERIGGSWTVTDFLEPPLLSAFDQFGAGVSVEDGRIAVASSNEGPTGAAHVFQHDGSDWSVTQSISGNALFGVNSVQLSNTRLFISGAPVRVLDPLGATTFCAAKTNSEGCAPSIGLSGQASLSSPAPAMVSATDVVSQRNGLFFYGLDGPAAIPFQGGSLCAQPPLRRTSLLNSGGDGSFCSGSYAFDLNAWIQGANDPNLVAASRVIGQFWSRDPSHPDGTGTGLTNAIDLLICQ